MRADAYVLNFATRNWYVAGRSDELGRAPLGRRICGRAIVIFRDDGGTAHALAATCPHRGADLSRGRVCSGTIQCPLHGFRYDRRGTCVEVPSQAPDAPIPSGLQVAQFPLREQQRLLWIWPDVEHAPDCDPPNYDFFQAETAYRRFQCRAELYPTSYVNAMENALDSGHLAFVHTGSVPGASARTGDFRLSIHDDRRGYRGEDVLAQHSDEDYVRRRRRWNWSSGVRMLNATLAALLHRWLEVADVKGSGFRCELNGLVCYHTDYENGTRDYAMAFLTPCDENRTWFFAEHLRNRALNLLGDWVTKRFMNTLVAEDRRAMTLLLPEAAGPSGLNPAVHVFADRQSLPFRRLYGEMLRQEGKAVPWSMTEIEVSASQI